MPVAVAYQRVVRLLDLFFYPVLCFVGLSLLFFPHLLISVPIVVHPSANAGAAYLGHLLTLGVYCVTSGCSFFLSCFFFAAPVRRMMYDLSGLIIDPTNLWPEPRSSRVRDQLRAVLEKVCSYWWVVPVSLLAGLLARLITASPSTAVSAGFLSVLAVVVFSALGTPHPWEVPAPPQPEVERGTTISSYDLGRQRSREECADQPFTIRWAGLDLPAHNENHFACIGITRSGKSLQLQDLLRSVVKTLPLTDPKATARRVLLFDPENKYVPLLHELAGEANVIITNPFDRRSRPWDIAKDITSPAIGIEMAEIFIPKQEQPTGEPFWQRAAATIVGSLIRALNEKATKGWTMRQFFHLFTKQRLLQIALTDARESNDLFNLLKQNNKTLVSVLSEIVTHMEKLRIIAALWDASVTKHGATPFTLAEWLDKDSRKVLHFGRPAEIEQNIFAVNRVIIKRLTQLIRSFPTHDDRIGQSWVFLDELPTLGNLDGLSRLLTEGASRKVRVVIAFQDINDMRNAYQNNNTPEVIANQCSHTSYLKCSGETAKWASGRLGQSEHWKTTTNAHTSVTRSENPSSTEGSGRSESLHIDDAVLASELSGLPDPKPTTQDGGVKGAIVRGWHVIPTLRVVCEAHDNDAFYPFDPIPDPSDAFQPRPVEEQKLREWDDATDWGEMGWCPANMNLTDLPDEIFGCIEDDE